MTEYGRAIWEASQLGVSPQIVREKFVAAEPPLGPPHEGYGLTEAMDDLLIVSDIQFGSRLKAMGNLAHYIRYLHQGDSK